MSLQETQAKKKQEAERLSIDILGKMKASTLHQIEQCSGSQTGPKLKCSPTQTTTTQVRPMQVLSCVYAAYACCAGQKDSDEH